MAGYTRNDTSNNIADGNVINAADFDGEYDAIEAAFNASTGHTHDGTAAEGAPITKVGPAQDVVVSTTSVLPKTDNTLDLGSSLKEFKDLYIDGTANIDSLVADSADINAGTIDNTTIGGTTAAAGSFTTATATTGNITNVNATTVDTTNLEVTNLKAKDGTSAGSIANTTGIVTLASSVLTTTDINGGTIDGATIATSDITVGTGKTLNVSGGTLTLADNQISGDKIEGGTINATTINTLTSTTGNITNVNATTVDSTNLEVTNLKAKDGTAAGSIADSSGVVTLASSVLTTTDINGGTIDGATIGGTTAAAGTFTSLTTSGNATIGGNLTVSGTTTTVNTETINLADNTILLNSNETGAPTQDSGIEIERGTSANKTFVWDETNDKWTVGSETLVAGTFEGNLTGNATTATTATTATNATNVALTNTSTSTSFYIPFASGNSTGNYALGVDSGLYYNPNLNQLSTSNINVTALYPVIIDFGDGTASTEHLRFGNSDDVKFFYDGTANTMEMELESSANSFIITDNGTTKFTFTKSTGDLTATGDVNAVDGTFSGNVTGANLNISNWNTAYGWGDHSSGGYLTSTTGVQKTSSTGSGALPSGTTAQRDGSPSAGYIRFNSTEGSFEGYNGSAWGSIGGGATGAGGDAVFYENDQIITTSYSITSGRNAMSTGPITVNSGASVTVPSGSRWVVL